MLAVAVAGWALAAVMAPRDAGWLHFGVALIVTVLLAFSVLTIRLRTYRELHAEHLAEVRAIRERYLGEREKVDSDVAGKASVLQARGEMDGLWDWDLTTDRLYFSPRWKSMLGYSDRDLDLSSEDWLNLIHFHDLHIVTERLWAHLYGKAENFEAEHRIQQANGDYRWVLTRGCAIRNEAGESGRMVGSMVDIKLLKNFAERLLHDASHDRLTGLPNREYLFERIRAELRRQRGNEHYLFAVIFLDLDRFKDVNDSLRPSGGRSVAGKRGPQTRGGNSGPGYRCKSRRRRVRRVIARPLGPSPGSDDRFQNSNRAQFNFPNRTS